MDVVTFIEQPGSWPVICPQLRDRSSDVINRVAAQVRAVLHPANRAIALCGAPATGHSTGRLEWISESRPMRAASDLRRQS